jgi:hypothetical protein
MVFVAEVLEKARGGHLNAKFFEKDSATFLNSLFSATC